MHRVLDAAGLDVLDLGQAQLLALVHVHRAGQGHDQQRGGPGPAQAEGQVGGGARPLEGEGERGVLPAVAGHGPGHVVVGDDPGGRRPDQAVGAQGGVDALPHAGRVPGAGQQVEVERRVQLVGPQVERELLGVLRPHLADERPGLVVAVGQPPPRAVDLVHLVAVLVGVLAGGLVAADLPQRRVLDQQGRRVDAHPGHAPVEPEPEDVLVLPAHVGVAPVEVGLLGAEQVEVPVAGAAVGVLGAGPGRAAEVGHPAVGRLVAVGAGAGPEPEPLPLRRARLGGQGGDEPRVLVGDVVGDDVDDRPQAGVAGLGDERLGLGQRAEGGVDGPVVGDVVAAVGHRRRVPGVEPQGVDAEGPQVRQAGADAGQVARPVAVGVGEAADVHLVDGGATPPGARAFVPPEVPPHGRGT